MKIKIRISAQVKEWYGNGEPNQSQGRFKNKGGADFLLEVDEITFIYNEEKIRLAFNAHFDDPNSHYRYEWLGAELYDEPRPIILNEDFTFSD